jgi:predicted transcriptional regulator
LDVSTISRKLGLSESHVSHEVRALEELNLINVTYERGKRGIRKISSSTIEKITINIGDEDHSFF